MSNKPAIENNLGAWRANQKDRLLGALREMAASIVRGANPPVDTGALIHSGRVEPTQNGFQAAFGGESVDVPYARIWELGDPWHLNPHFKGVTRDGRVAPLNYLKDTGNAVVGRGIEVYL